MLNFAQLNRRIPVWDLPAESFINWAFYPLFGKDNGTHLPMDGGCVWKLTTEGALGLVWGARGRQWHSRPSHAWVGVTFMHMVLINLFRFGLGCLWYWWISFLSLFLKLANTIYENSVSSLLKSHLAKCETGQVHIFTFWLGMHVMFMDFILDAIIIIHLKFPFLIFFGKKANCRACVKNKYAKHDRSVVCGKTRPLKQVYRKYGGRMNGHGQECLTSIKRATLFFRNMLQITVMLF